MKNYTSFYGGEKKSFYGFFIQNTSEERVLKRGPSQTVSFNAEKLVQLLSLIADFYPIQNGNGQPSPENIQAISGRTFADVCISPTLDAGDGKIYHVIFPTQVGTAYGGTIDMINKTLTINYLYKTFTGQEDWEIYFPPRTARYCRLVLGEHGSVINDSGICSHFPQKLINSSQSSIEDGQRIVNSSAIPYAIICIRYVEKQKTVDEFKDWLREQYNAGTPVQVAYKISNPTVYNIDIDSVTLYPNNNNIWIENGDITIQYKINKNVYYNTVNGNPCILDKSMNTSITNLLLDIQPMQDLHGYDAPWSAGGEKNLLNPNNYKVGYYINSNGALVVGDKNIAYDKYILLEAGKTYTISCNSTLRNIGICLYASNKSTVLSRYNNYNVTSVTIAANSSVRYVRFWFDIDGTVMTIARLEAKQPQFELGSVATSYVPYSNICPIVGFTDLQIIRCGKNLIDPSQFVNKTIAGEGNFIDKNDRVMTGYIDIIAGETYIPSCEPGKSFVACRFYKSDKTPVVNNGNITTLPITAPSNAKYVCIVFKKDDDSTFNILELMNAQLEFGSIATTYEPYYGNLYNITFPSEAGTVYGGTLDVTRSLLTVDRLYKSLDGTEGWALFSGAVADRSYFYLVIGDSGSVVNDSGICSHFMPVNITSNTTVVGQKIVNSAANNARLLIRPKDAANATVDTFKTWLAGEAQAGTPVQICYKISNPIVYQLTPTQINALDNLTILTTDVNNITATYKAKNK